jgi:hypothetical protein
VDETKRATGLGNDLDGEEAATKYKGLPEKRENESFDAWRRRFRIAQAINTHGMRVRCRDCNARGRHRPVVDGPLRERRCPKCHNLTLRRISYKELGGKYKGF